MAPTRRADRDRPVMRWAWLIVAVTLCVSIGLPLVGTRVFFPADLLQRFHPWKDQTPPGYRIANPLLTDPVDATMPTRAESRSRILKGDYPMWAPESTGGGPLGTVPNSSMSPLELPYLVLPLWYAPALVKLLEMVAAVLFTYLFARRIGLGRIPASVGGLIYAFSGFQVVWTFWPQSIMGALIPALFWTAERGLQRGNVRSMLPVSVVVAIMVLEGFPPVLLYAGVAAGLYVLVRVLTSHEWDVGRCVKGLASFGGAAVLGLAITALQVLPFLDQLRSLDVGYRAQTTDSHLPLRALMTLLVPNAFGSPVDGSFFGRLHYAPTGFVRTGYLEQQSFIGATALVLVLAAAIKLWRQPGSNPLPRGVKSYLWTGLALMIVLMYVGGPVLGLLEKIPPFGTNYIGRLRSVMGFFLACLGAVGLHALLDRGRRPVPRTVWVFGVTVVALAVSIVALGLWRVLELAGEVQRRRYVLRQSVLPLAVAAIAVSSIGLNGRRWLGERRLMGWVVPPLVAMEALAFALPFWPRVPKWTFYPTTPAHRFLEAHLGREREASQGNVLYPGTTTFYGLRSVTGHQFPQCTWTDLLTALDPHALNLPTLPVLRGKGALITSPLLDRLSARYFVDAPEDPVLGRRVKAPPVGGVVPLRAGESLSAMVAAGRIRAIVVRLIGSQGWRGSGDLIAQVLAWSGAVRSTGRLHLTSVRPGQITIPVVEQPRAGAGSVEVRLLFRAPSGALILASAGPQRPAVSVVLGEDDGLRLVFADGATIYQRMNAFPRIRWAAHGTVIPDPAKRIFALSQGVAADAVVLSEKGPRGSGRSARLRVLQDGDDEIRVSAVASGQGYLVVADAIQHGWEARMDGRPVLLRAADHAGVAVLVPTGRHQVTLRYIPPGWKPGLVISGISVVLLLALALWLPGRPLAEGSRW
ncbi:MAG TPA: YfhO family protein [Actinomycetota bacterium]|nr:YfhO family protein [Actinomycetota bacterium]